MWKVYAKYDNKEHKVMTSSPSFYPGEQQQTNKNKIKNGLLIYGKI